MWSLNESLLSNTKHYIQVLNRVDGRLLIIIIIILMIIEAHTRLIEVRTGGWMPEYDC